MAKRDEVIHQRWPPKPKAVLQAFAEFLLWISGHWQPSSSRPCCILYLSLPDAGCVEKAHEQRTTPEARSSSEVCPEQHSRNWETLRLIALAGFFSQLCKSDGVRWKRNAALAHIAFFPREAMTLQKGGRFQFAVDGLLPPVICHGADRLAMLRAAIRKRMHDQYQNFSQLDYSFSD